METRADVWGHPGVRTAQNSGAVTSDCGRLAHAQPRYGPHARRSRKAAGHVRSRDLISGLGDDNTSAMALAGDAFGAISAAFGAISAGVSVAQLLGLVQSQDQ